MKAERMWTYEEIGQALAMHPRAVQHRVRRMALLRFRKPQSTRTYIRQSDVNRLFTAYWIRRGNGWRKGISAEELALRGNNGSAKKE